MRNQRQQLYATLGVASLLAACVPDPDRAAPVDQVLARGGGEVAAGAKCRKWLSVSSTTDEHLQPQQKFRVSGPNADGDYRLRRIGSGHQVQPGDHDLVQSSAADDEFVGEIEIKGGPHGNVDLHFYELTMEFDTDGCPSRVSLKTLPHAGDTGQGVHGGDAVLD